MIKNFQSQVTIAGRTICGYAAVFNNLDSAGDIIKPGAFTKTISENGPARKNNILFLNQHQPRQPLGKPNELRELKLSEFSAVTFPCNELARVTDVKEGLFSAVEHGEPDEVAEFIRQLKNLFPDVLTQDEKFAIELKALADDRFGGGSLADKLVKIFNNL
ncbi:MAG: hypothetical protein NVSMB7_12730 [Chitinophagaceae bacterium]